MWERPDVDRETLSGLNQRITWEGMARLIVHTAWLVAVAWLTVYLSRYHFLLAVAPYLLFTYAEPVRT